MCAIFGVVNFDASPPDVTVLEKLRIETASWGRDGARVINTGMAGFGSALNQSTPEASFERLPLLDANGILFTAAGRIDNREELGTSLGIEPATLRCVADGTLIYHAWQRWGDSCTERMFGDWALAAWDPHVRKLLLARDHFGVTALYYYANSRLLAFSSSRRALLKLNLAAVEMDELYVAQVLIAWHGDRGERTVHRQIKRLPPAHRLTATPEGVETRQYWHVENTPELNLPRNEYIPAFLGVFDRAVRDRLRCTGTVGAQLSGGLDSGSVAITAAGYLAQEARRLAAFTAVPIFPAPPWEGAGFGDEFPFARATAESAGNIDLHRVEAAGRCPVEAIRSALRISMEPKHGAASCFWTLELRRLAAERGCRVLLSGQAGNMGISWPGDIFSQPVPVQIRQLGRLRWLRQSILRHAPKRMRSYRATKRRFQRLSAIHPDLARRTDLFAHFLDDEKRELTESPVFARFSGIQPGRSSVGAHHAEMGAAFGFEARDPTGDPRVLEFCFSVPDRIFIDPATGVDRWLIREAMKGRLPDSVRTNRRRGRQAADLVPRLRNSAAAVDSALAEIEAGPAAAYVSVPVMRKVWERLRAEDSLEALVLAVTVLTRGIAVGLFVNGFGTEW